MVPAFRAQASRAPRLVGRCGVPGLGAPVIFSLKTDPGLAPFDGSALESVAFSMSFDTREWRNRQTRTVQVRVPVMG